jgi:hypothetical protein
MAADAARQRRHDRLALRRQPALAAVAHHPRGEHQVLHLVRLGALEPRTLRYRHSKHLGLGRDPRCHLAAAAALGAIAAGLRLGPFLHAARLDRWTASGPSAEQSHRAALSRSASAQPTRPAVPRPELRARHVADRTDRRAGACPARIVLDRVGGSPKMPVAGILLRLPRIEVSRENRCALPQSAASPLGGGRAREKRGGACRWGHGRSPALHRARARRPAATPAARPRAQ